MLSALQHLVRRHPAPGPGIAAAHHVVGERVGMVVVRLPPARPGTAPSVLSTGRPRPRPGCLSPRARWLRPRIGCPRSPARRLRPGVGRLRRRSSSPRARPRPSAGRPHLRLLHGRLGIWLSRFPSSMPTRGILVFA